MPTGRNWINFIYVILGFIAQILLMYYFIALVDIKDNWEKYRCNPMYMPLADNVGENFTYCIQNTQMNMMGYLLQPINYMISGITDIAGEFSTNINGVRQMLSFIRTSISNITENIFGVFMNLIIQFQSLTIAIKDTIGKVIGVVVTFLYILDGSMKTMESTWAGPPGQMVRLISGKCFHPKTKVKLINGKTVYMKDINLGDILENGSKVTGTLKLDNSDPNTSVPLYKIDGGIDNDPIFVTGSHFILKRYGNINVEQDYVKVEDYDNSIIQDKVKSDYYVCLKTNDNKIVIGRYVFWDWEDDNLTYNYSNNKI
jgi:hypothetical protein